jgi:hypothetical protein
VRLERKERDLVQKLLSNPADYPDEFKSWLIRFVNASPSLQLAVAQLPSVEARAEVGGAGRPPFLNGWTNFGSGHAPASFHKDPQGYVHLGGFVQSGTIGAAIFQLPANYRPRERVVFPVDTDTGHGRVDVAAGGDVVAFSGGSTYLSLDGISFRAL